MSERPVVPVCVSGWLPARRALPTAFATWKEPVEEASSADLPAFAYRGATRPACEWLRGPGSAV